MLFKHIARSLRVLTQPPHAPFSIDLLGKETLYCDTCIRFLAGKRLVIFGTFKNKPVVAKLFFSKKRAKKNVAAEINGSYFIHKVGLLAPRIYYADQAMDQNCQVVIFERILDANNLHSIWHALKEDADRIELLSLFIIELAKQHESGIFQKDLHLSNFLLKGNDIYLLDAQQIVYTKKPIGFSKSLQHIALFFSQLEIQYESELEDILRIYLACRQLTFKKKWIRLLRYHVQKQRDYRFKKYKKKLFRPCSEILFLKNKNKIMACKTEENSVILENWMQHTDALFEENKKTILKAGQSSTVIRFQENECDWVIKCYNIKNLFHWCRRFFRPTRAVHHWIFSHRLMMLGIPSAKPVAFVEYRRWGCRFHSYFFMQTIAGIDAGEYFSKTEQMTPVQASVATRIVSIFQALARAQLIHGDMKSKNFIIHYDEAYLIDLDGMRKIKDKRKFKKLFKKEVTRFLKNWDEVPVLQQWFEKALKKQD